MRHDLGDDATGLETEHEAVGGNSYPEAALSLVARWDLTNKSPDDTGLVFGELIRELGGWQFRLLSRGYVVGLREIGQLYGIEFAD